MKRYFAVIIMAFAFTLTACGSSTGADQDSKAAPESSSTAEVTTTTTTKAVESEPDSKSEDSSKAETTTALAKKEPEVTTFNTEWHPSASTTNLAIGAGRHVYAAPTIESEQIGEIKAGDVVICVGYVNEHWNVIQWNNDVGFIQTNLSDNVQIDEPLYDEPVYEEPIYDEPVQDDTAGVDEDLRLG